jgi:RHS repeat-associated protein
MYESKLRRIAEYDGTGNLIARYIYGAKINVPEYMVKNGVTYRIITDYQGSVRYVIDVSNGTIAQNIDYDEYGVVEYNSNPGFTPFGCAGGMYDHQTGLVRFGARDYDAESGRWNCKDPIKFVGGNINFYRYVRNDLLNKNDYYGLWDFANEYGTTGEGLTDQMSNIEGAVDQAYQNASGTNNKATVTYTTNGRHSANSLHYSRNAYDLRVMNLTSEQTEDFAQEIRDAIGDDYDILNEGDHIHVEYDP